MNLDTNDLKNVITTLVSSFDKEDLELYSDLIDRFKIKQYNRLDEFDMGVLYPFRKFQRLLIQGLYNTNDNKLVFLIQQYSYVESHFQKLFQKYEGSFACADKSRTVVDRLFGFYTEGEQIKFNYDGEYTYHLPKILFKTHDDIISFYDAIVSLYYGNSDLYIHELGKIMEIMKEEEAINKIRENFIKEINEHKEYIHVETPDKDTLVIDIPPIIREYAIKIIENLPSSLIKSTVVYFYDTIPIEISKDIRFDIGETNYGFDIISLKHYQDISYDVNFRESFKQCMKKLRENNLLGENDV